MRQVVVVLVLIGVLAAGGWTLVSAQDPAGTITNELGTPCAGMESLPVASPDAGLMASPEASPMATEASPVASPVLVLPGCVTEGATPPGV